MNLWSLAAYVAILGWATSCSKSDGDAGNSVAGNDGGREECSSSCDDGISCTVDVCVSGECQHSIGPNSGKTKCPAGQFCTVGDGCTVAPACATDEDCEEAFKGDACKDNPRCDPASSVCLFDLLDKDGDGHAPQICGGDDCDDDNRQVYPKAIDGCDGIDNDCDGQVDEEPSCSEMHECIDGACECLSEYLCGSSCVDTQTDPDHCGECDNLCPVGGICIGGQCECPDETSLCGDECVDLQTDYDNCGECGLACPRGQYCESGLCGCFDIPSATCEGFNCGQVAAAPCGDACVDILTDSAHCGGCDAPCGTREYCNGGVCVPQYWRQVYPYPSAPLRGGHTNGMVFDAARDLVVLFGGVSADGSYKSDTWEFDGAAWGRASDAPASLAYHAMAYDHGRERTVLFGGDRSFGASSNYSATTFEYEGAKWAEVLVPSAPPARYGHAMAYDDGRERVVLFGGFDSDGLMNDTWEYDGSTWIEVTTPDAPKVRSGHAMAFDAERARVVLFGGYNLRASSSFNDTWEYDGTNWLEIETAVKPRRRSEHTLAYDAGRHRVVLFGGVTNGGSGLDDTWEYDGSNWAEVPVSLAPQWGRGAAMTYDPTREVIVLFEGSEQTWDYVGP